MSVSLSAVDPLEIVPRTRPPRMSIRVPGSKSITNRALVLSALSNTRCTLHGALHSEDTEVMVESLRQLGWTVETDWPGARLSVSRGATERLIPATEANLFVGNSGTSMRFLTALVALGLGRYRLDGIARMRERPIADLLSALQALGVKASCEFDNGCPPVVVESSGIPGGRVSIRGDLSSQFLSGLLMAAPHARAALQVEVEGTLVSVPYVTMTVELMRQFGLQIEMHGTSRFVIPAPQEFGRAEYTIEPDASAASYFFGAAAILGGELTVPGLSENSLQGDVRFADVLGQMGCHVTRSQQGTTVRGGPLRGLDVDMNDISDCVMTLAAVACFAEGPTTIRNVAHVRHKETDRLAALAAELKKFGVGVEERSDGLTIQPRPLHGATVDTYNDHRMAMSLALVGLRVPGVRVRNPGCVAKTYPDFFQDLARI
jgi:3-phosphoshikimate 1-carboxyvinyltransferase